MKKALICPTGVTVTGYRVAQVEDQPFEVALPLFWVDCADDVEQDKFWFDPADATIKPVPQEIPVDVNGQPQQPTVEGAQTL